MRQMKRVFADANGWIALNSKWDGLHDVAVRVNRDLLSKGCRYITTNFVLDESYTSLLTNVGHFAAVSLERKFANQKSCRLFTLPKKLKNRRGNCSSSIQTRRFLLLTARPYIVMQQFGLSEAFTSDHHFD